MQVYSQFFSYGAIGGAAMYDFGLTLKKYRNAKK